MILVALGFVDTADAATMAWLTTKVGSDSGVEVAQHATHERRHRMFASIDDDLKPLVVATLCVHSNKNGQAQISSPQIYNGGLDKTCLFTAIKCDPVPRCKQFCRQFFRSGEKAFRVMFSKREKCFDSHRLTYCRNALSSVSMGAKIQICPPNAQNVHPLP